MLFNAPPNPTKVKHAVYLVASTVLGIILSFIVHAAIETWYLQWALNHQHRIHWFGGCALHPVIQIGLVVISAFGGFFLGRFWWRWVYIERTWARGIGQKSTNHNNINGK